MDEFLGMIFPDNSFTTTPDVSPIATLVFMDLEATGLPSSVGKNNVHITELSMVAIDRLEFERNKMPRVLNKLSLCIRPRSLISYGAMRITGLYNDMLDAQQPFNDSVPKLLDIFFSRLKPPVCLVAHNGKGYDFPLLQAEIKRLGSSLPENILCVDSLEAFRKLGLMPSNCVPDNCNGVVENKATTSNINKERVITDDIIEELLSDGIEEFRDIKIPWEDEYVTSVNTTKPVTGITLECKQTNLLLKKSENIRSVLQRETIDRNFNEVTPNRYSKAIQASCYKMVPKYTVSDPAKCQNKISSNHNNHIPVKRKLFSPNDEPFLNKKIKCTEITKIKLITSSNKISENESNKTFKRAQYSLENLYLHYFGEPAPDDHHAESDCINLYKVCQKVSKQLLPWFDSNKTPFSDITSMW